MRARKKPVTVSTVRWTGENFSEVQWLAGDDVHLEDGTLKVKTKEGDLTAALGDYIIKGVQGEHYPCKPDIFEATYERVCGLCDEPGDKFFTVPEAEDERRHGICAKCDTAGAAAAGLV